MPFRGRARGRRSNDDATTPSETASADPTTASTVTLGEGVEGAGAPSGRARSRASSISGISSSNSGSGSGSGSGRSRPNADAPVQAPGGGSNISDVQARLERIAMTEPPSAAAAPARRSSRSPGANPERRGGDRRRDDFIDGPIFGGFSKDNKKEYLSYVASSRDNREKGKEYKAGGKGDAVDLRCNSFSLGQTVDGRFERLPDIHMNQYHVAYEPQQDSTRKRIRILQENINQFTDTPSEGDLIFDGAVLFLPATILLKGRQQEVSRNIFVGTVNDVKVTIKHTAPVSSGNPTVKQILNRVFRDAQGAANMVLIGRNYFNASKPSSVPKYNIDIWPGFSTRIDQYDGGFMLTLDTISKIMRRKNCLEMLTEFFTSGRQEEATKKAEKEIVGETVLTKFNNKNYRVDGIDWDMSPKDSFEKADGSKISYQDYYKMQYGLEVEPDQPMFVHRPKPKEKRMRDLQGLQGQIYLVPSLCYLTGLGTMRQDFAVMRDVAQVTRFAPQERVNHMKAFVQLLQSTAGSKAELAKLGISFDPEPTRIENGRVLSQTVISQGGNPLNYRREGADWSRELDRSPFTQSVPLENWVVFCPSNLLQQSRRFVQELQQVGRRVHMDVAMPEFKSFAGSGGAEYVRQIREPGVMEKSQLIMCVLPDDRKDRYDAIKQLLCCSNAVPSQNVLLKTITKDKILRSVATKVLMQMNCKIGGTLWDAGIPMKKKGVLMVVGIDTFVDAKVQARGHRKANGALVASVDPQATKWFSRQLLDNATEPLEEGLRRSFHLALKNFLEQNEQLPERIMVYRDGVGEGQLQNVQRDEIGAMHAACRAFGHEYEPKLTVTIVTKRVPQRFFERTANGSYKNPLPGTVVDQTVTKCNSTMFDYYIVSQSTNQGTVSPTHYNILFDQSGWDFDRHQSLAYKLCHLYYNWAGAIRVPAPCQYAHKLAFMVNQNLSRAPNGSVEQCQKLWYL